MPDSAEPSRESLPAPLQRALELALDTQARAPVLLRMTDVAGYTDWVLILSGRSERHVRGITEAITQGLRSTGVRPLGMDGLDDHLWDLLDYDDFMIHVFFHPVRTHYDLESMWRDAPRVDLRLPAEVMDTSDMQGLTLPTELPDFRGTPAFGGWTDEFTHEADAVDDDFGNESIDDDDDDVAADDYAATYEEAVDEERH